MIGTRCPYCRDHHVGEPCPTQMALMFPTSWTYLGLQGTRKGQVKPHFRTAPAGAKEQDPDFDIRGLNIFGSVETKVVYKTDEWGEHAYSYAIHRDGDGNVTKRTEPEYLSSLYWRDPKAPGKLEA